MFSYLPYVKTQLSPWGYLGMHQLQYLDYTIQIACVGLSGLGVEIRILHPPLSLTLPPPWPYPHMIHLPPTQKYSSLECRPAILSHYWAPMCQPVQVLKSMPAGWHMSLYWHCQLSSWHKCALRHVCNPQELAQGACTITVPCLDWTTHGRERISLGSIEDFLKNLLYSCIKSPILYMSTQNKSWDSTAYSWASVPKTVLKNRYSWMY